MQGRSELGLRALRCGVVLTRILRAVPLSRQQGHCVLGLGGRPTEEGGSSRLRRDVDVF